MNPATLCPLCGRPNACAPALTGTQGGPCWCQDVIIPRAVLERIPKAQRGLACVCRDCATQKETVPRGTVSTP